jgi:hypothetical protein
MDFYSFFSHNGFYILIGIILIILTFFTSYRTILRVDLKAILKWIIFLVVVFLIRLVLYKLSIGLSIFAIFRSLPLSITPFVFWEDAVFGLPLLLFRNHIKDTNKICHYIFYILLGLFSFIFAAAHIYQSLWTFGVMLFYIYVTNDYARRYGYGTIMICHVLFDFITILTFQYFLV